MVRLLIFMVAVSVGLNAQVTKEMLIAESSYISARCNEDVVVFVGTDEAGVPNLFVQDDRRQVSFFETPDIIQFFVSGDWVLVLKDEDGRGSLGLHGFNLKSDKHWEYAKGQASVFAVSGLQAAVGVGESVYRLDLETGVMERLFEKGEFADFLFDDRLQMALKMRIEEDGSWSVFRGSGQLWMEVPAEATFSTRWLRADGEGAYMLDSRTTDMNRLIYKAFSGEEIVLGGDEKCDIEEVLFIDGKPAAFATCYARRTWRVLDSEIASDIETLKDAVGGDFAFVSVVGQRWIVETSSPTEGVKFWLYERGNLKLLHSMEIEGAPMHEMVVQARDGQELVCYYTLPKGAGGPVPLVVFPHGGPFHMRDHWGFNSMHQWLAGCGYAVLSVNFRMSSGFGKAFVTGGNGMWGGVAHNDVVDSVKACFERGITTADQVAILGGSYGGYEALVSLTQDPDLYKAVVCICGPSNLKTVLDHVPPYWQFTKKKLSDEVAFFTKRAFIISIGGDPDTVEGEAHLQECSPLNRLDQISRPLLLMHGRNDHIVGERESQQIYESMKRRNLDVTYLLFPDEGHRFGKIPNKLVMLDWAERFPSQYLGGKYTPIAPQIREESSVVVSR